ncbi:autotransporter outer membrane beta-barrel domain-containing protein [Phaeovibrio sulfidiphilus]|uniref:Autotransporter outer membrane beta-barrel domain-containing protein n=1 Tax=Phaeovibrio sulfidiphilus TaxID=1220600 RepID=A0A8J7CVF4_9PROT|nr:autotransporter outer membrane beta-barrel domain-containing protein [Phaeovibrio sulfidiphilus]MBE1236241.1 autotransporter outer membrane beta-barrel domain-containing protein [Phaeovibrio sulfidiphilus]
MRADGGSEHRGAPVPPAGDLKGGEAWVTGDVLQDGDTLTVTGGKAGAFTASSGGTLSVGAGGEARWSGSFAGVDPNGGMGSVTLAGGEGSSGWSVADGRVGGAGASGGAATVTLNGPLVLASGKTLTIQSGKGGDGGALPNGRGGDGGDVTAVFSGTVSTALGTRVEIGPGGQGGRGGQGAGSTGGSAGTVTVSFLEDVVVKGQYRSTAVAGGEGGVGDGGSGGRSVVTFAKKLVVLGGADGTLTLSGAAGGDASGRGRGGDGTAKHEIFGEVEVGYANGMPPGEYAAGDFFIETAGGGSVLAGSGRGAGTGTGGNASTITVDAGRISVYGNLVAAMNSTGDGATGGSGSDTDSGGRGGRSTDVILRVEDTLEVRQATLSDGSPVYYSGRFVLQAGHGGASGLAGKGGEGGGVFLSVGGRTLIGGDAEIVAGGGGFLSLDRDARETREGGAGGDVRVVYGASRLTGVTDVCLSSGTTLDHQYRVIGGIGSLVNSAGVGGRGGNVEEIYHGAAVYAGGASFASGSGGEAWGEGGPARGGDGGDVRVSYASDITFGNVLRIGIRAQGGSVATGGDAGDSGAIQVTVGRDLVSASGGLEINPASGGGILSGFETAGRAGNGRGATLSVARDVRVGGDHSLVTGYAGNSRAANHQLDPRIPTGAVVAGVGGDLEVSVGGTYQAGRQLVIRGGDGGHANEKVAGARAGNARIAVGTLDVAGEGLFIGGRAGSASINFTGGNGGSVTVDVSRGSAYFGQGLSLRGGGQTRATGDRPLDNGSGGDVTLAVRGGHVHVADHLRIYGGNGHKFATGRGSVSRLTADTLTVTNMDTHSGRISGTWSDFDDAGFAAPHAGEARVEVSVLRTGGGSGSVLNIDRAHGSVFVTATTLFAANEDLTLKLNERPVTGTTLPGGAYRVAFTHLGMSGGRTLSLASATGSPGWTWQAGGHLYAGNAVQNGVNTPNRLDVTRTDRELGEVAVPLSASGRTVVFDVANLAHVPNEGLVPQILSVNAGSKDGSGLAISDTTKVNILGADNVRLGQAVNLVNTAAGSTFTGHNGAGTIGDTWGNVADATYSLGIVTAADKKNYLQATITGFEIRKDWVIDNDRDLTTTTTADANDVRRLSLPGTLTIVDNRYSGPNSIAITVDDNKGTRGRADLWADRIHVATTNTVSRDWIENPVQITATTLDFQNAVAGNLKDRSARGVAFSTLWLGSGSQTVVRGDMAGAGGTGNYAFGGRLEVGDMFRGYHTSARLAITSTAPGQALTVNEALFHLSNDLPGRIAEADAWQAKFDGQRLATGSDGKKNKLVTETGANGIVALEVVGGTAPIVHLDRDRSVDLSQRLDSIDDMESLRKSKEYAQKGINPRLTLVDRIQGDVSTIRGRTFSEDRAATIEARSWAHQGFIEGVYAVGYGNNDATDTIRDWGTNDSVIAEFRGIAADRGTSALQARTASETLLNQGQDLLVDAFDTALPLGAYNPARGIQPVAMVTVGGGHSRVTTGSDVSGTGFSLAAGPGVALDHEYGRTTVGVLFEAGWGGYDLNNAFAWRGAFNGRADASYYGGALVVRHDSFCNGIYADASVRAGYVDAEYEGHQSATNFDTDATYVGGHVGLGMLVDTWQDGQADLYAKGLFAHMGSDTASDTAGEELRFDSSLSARSRLGARLSHTFLPSLKGYVGAAWEYEFDGTQKGSARKIGSPNVAHIPAIDVMGHTGIGEVGVQWTALETLSVGAGFQGSVGQRDSYGGTARVMYRW